MTELQDRPPADVSLPIAEEPASFVGRWARAHHILLYFVIASTLVWLCTGFYRVNADEVAIIERLGQYLTDNEGKARIYEPGVSYHLPWPIDTVHKIPVEQKRTLLVNTFNAPANAYEDFRKSLLRRGASPDVISAIFDPYVITGDQNVVHIELAVQYKIEDPEAWLTTVAGKHKETDDSREALMNFMVCDAIIKELGKLPVDGVLLEGRQRLPDLLRNAADKAMQFSVHEHDTQAESQKHDEKDHKHHEGEESHADELHLGAKVSQVDVTAVRPPNYVKSAFEAVLQAQADRDVLRSRAMAEANNLRNQAEAQKRQLETEAEAYRNSVVERARGEKARFEQVYAQYRNAPDITKWAIYTDTLREVMRSADRIFYVQPGQKPIITVNPPQFDAGQGQPGNNGGPGQ